MSVVSRIFLSYPSVPMVVSFPGESCIGPVRHFKRTSSHDLLQNDYASSCRLSKSCRCLGLGLRLFRF